MPAQISFQGMQIRARIVHIAYGRRRVQAIQNGLKLLRMLRLNALLRSAQEKLFQPLVLETFNHTNSVTLKVTTVKGPHQLT